jgi:methylenetetrahydrofolate/methylenetetrahydromethanopterin dehydrogenase (NADP+)
MSQTKSQILVQIDSDDHASVFDAVVAIDAGVDHLLQYHGVTEDDVQGLVHGSIFTRGAHDLKSTAIFLGGTDVAAAERLLRRVLKSFFGPLRVSVMMDASGANTTAVAAVLAASRHVPLRGATALVLAATGPVGQRIVRLLAREGARVRVASRDVVRAERVCDLVRERVKTAELTAVGTTLESLPAALEGASMVIAAGAAGIELVPAHVWQSSQALRVAIDLNAVPPLGIAGVEATDKAVLRGEVTCYGAIGVGGTKMKIHSTAIARLFQSNSQVLDAEEIFALGRELED